MQLAWLLAAATLLDAARSVAAITLASRARGYGPGGCISISRSTTGSCVLTTSCAGKDIANFDFKFDCVTSSNGTRITHDLGVGSFDEAEDFDTDVQCQQCLPPQALSALATAVVARNTSSAQHAPQQHATVLLTKSSSRKAQSFPKATAASSGAHAFHVQKVKKKVQQEPEGRDGPIEKYGPAMCVRVWRDKPTGHCIMQTRCEHGAVLDFYDFGFICAGKSGELTRHLFGRNSFLERETFDTLIPCDRCMALDDKPMDQPEAIKILSGQIEDLTSEMKQVTSQIGKLNAKAFPAGQGPPAGLAPAPASAAMPQQPAAKAGGQTVSLHAQNRGPAPVQQQQQSGQYADEAEDAAPVDQEPEQVQQQDQQYDQPDEQAQSSAGEAYEEPAQNEQGEATAPGPPAYASESDGQNVEVEQTGAVQGGQNDDQQVAQGQDDGAELEGEE